MSPSKFFDRATPPHISTLILLSGVSALNMSAFLPSLSAMSQHFDAPYSVMQLAVSLYLAATSVVQIAAGPLSDRFGRRPVLMAALGIFMLASLGCIFAPNVTTFLAFRIIQGAVATAMVLSRAIVRDMYDSDKAASMLSYVIMGMSVVPMFGPMIGGALQELYGWQGSFVLLFAAGAICATVVWFDLAETSSTAGQTLREQFSATPELLRSQRFWAYVLTAVFSSGSYFALLGGASHVAGNVFQLSPSITGIALGAPAVGYMLGNWISARFAVRVGLDRMVLWGALLTAGFMTLSWILGIAGWHSPWIFFGLCTALGLGNGLVMPNTMAGMLSVRPKLAGTASGIGGAAQIGGGAIIASITGLLLDHSPTALPLQAVMALSATAAVACAYWAHHRNRTLAAMD